MTAYLTSVGFLPHHQAAGDEDAVCPVDSALIKSRDLEQGNYALLWDYFEHRPSEELYVSFAFKPENGDNAARSFTIPALPFFSNEALRDKVITGMSDNPLSPSVSFKSSVAILREQFDALNPIDMVDQLKRVQEQHFIGRLAQEIEFDSNSDAESTFAALHHAISIAITDDHLKRYVYERPLVLHPGMQDHVYFKDIQSLEEKGHVHPINLENFGPDDTSRISYD